MFEFEVFMVEGGGGAEASTPVDPIMADIAELGLNAVVQEEETDEKPEAKVEPEAKKEPAAKEEDKEEPERGEDGKFKKAEAEPKEDEGDDGAEAQAAWDKYLADEEAAKPKPEVKEEAKPEPKPELKPEAKKEEVQPKVDTPDLPEFTAQDLEDSNGEVILDAGSVRTKLNSLVKTLQLSQQDNADLKARLARLEATQPALEYLRQTELKRTYDLAHAQAVQAAETIKSTYGLKITPQQVLNSMKGLIDVYQSRGYVQPGTIPNAATQVEMWELDNRGRLTAAGIKRRSESEPETKETEKKAAPRLLKTGGSSPNGKSEPANDDEAILQDIQMIRAGQKLR